MSEDHGHRLMFWYEKEVERERIPRKSGIETLSKRVRSSRDAPGRLSHWWDR